MKKSRNFVVTALCNEAVNLLAQAKVAVSFLLDGVEYPAGTCFGELAPGTRIELIVRVGDLPNWRKPTVGFTKVSPTGEKTPVIFMGANEYCSPITLGQMGGPLGVAKWPGNRRYILVPELGSVFSLFQAGLFTQSGQTWAWVQQFDKDVVTVNRNGRINAGNFGRSEAIQEFLVHALQRARLREDDTRETFQEPEAPAWLQTAPSGSGEVLYLNLFEGGGSGYAWFAWDGAVHKVKIHWKGVVNPDEELIAAPAGRRFTGVPDIGIHHAGPAKGQTRWEAREIQFVD